MSSSSSVMNLSKYPEAEVSARCISWIECSRQVNRKQRKKKNESINFPQNKANPFKIYVQCALRFVFVFGKTSPPSPPSLGCCSMRRRTSRGMYFACARNVRWSAHIPVVHVWRSDSKIISKHRVLGFVVLADTRLPLLSHPLPSMMEWSVFLIHLQLSIDVEHKMKLHITHTSHRPSASLSIIFFLASFNFSTLPCRMHIWLNTLNIKIFFEFFFWVSHSLDGFGYGYIFPLVRTFVACFAYSRFFFLFSLACGVRNVVFAVRRDAYNW